jgi:hypothetical protein
MKSAARFSAWAALAALLCFAPCALGQGTGNTKGTQVGNSGLNYAASSFLTFTLTAGGHHKDGDGWGGGNGGGGNGGGNGGGGNGCGNQGGGGGWGGGGCTPVPEGGNALMYLSLAGICCFGAMIFRLRRMRAAS